MAKVKGLVFLSNEKPKPNETFIKKMLYRYVPLFATYNSQKQKRTVTTYIELFIHAHKICVISFYNEGFGGEKNRYKVRCKLGTGHTFMLVHRDHEYQTECINFIDKFNQQVLDDIENPNDDLK